MRLRVFSVKSDGSYSEVPAKSESFFQGSGAYLLVDRETKKIYIYRKDGISSSLSYWAARAATNLKIQKGSNYQVINIEQEERDRILSELIKNLEDVTYSEEKITLKTDLGLGAYVYGEKTIPALTLIQSKKENKVDEDSD